MNELQFMEAIEKHPGLTASGFGVTHGGDVAAERAALTDHYEAFCRLYEFLQSMSGDELKKLFQRDSYAIKHAVERAAGIYVPEGAFDMAAVVFGCTVARTIDGSPSVYFEVPSLPEGGQRNMQI